MVLLKALAGTAAAVVTTGLAAAGVGTVGHADATPAAKPPTKVQCQANKSLPANLRSDLQDARKLPAGQRGKALRAIREKALHSDDYGTRAQRWAERRVRQHAFVAGQMPRDLRQDLRAVRKLPAEQRPDKRKEIRGKVLTGDYGERAQKRAQRVQENRRACAVKLPKRQSKQPKQS